MNTEQRIAGFGEKERCGDLLSITSSKGGLKAEVATVLGAQQFFHESGAPKRSAFTTPEPCFVTADCQDLHCSRCVVAAAVTEVDLGVMVLSHLSNGQMRLCAVKQGACMALCSSSSVVCTPQVNLPKEWPCCNMQADAEASGRPGGLWICHI